MQRSKVKKFASYAILIFLILWGSASFFVFPTAPVAQWSMLIVSLIAIYLTIVSSSEYFVLLYITISNSYLLYGLLFTYGFPLWIIMVGLVIFLGSGFWLLGRKMVSEKTNFSLILILFLLSMLEIYLALSFWLINPLTRSTVLATVAYIFYGYLASTSSDVFVTRRFYAYLYVAAAVFLVLILTVSWGR